MLQRVLIKSSLTEIILIEKANVDKLFWLKSKNMKRKKSTIYFCTTGSYLLTGSKSIDKSQYQSLRRNSISTGRRFFFDKWLSSR